MIRGPQTLEVWVKDDTGCGDEWYRVTVSNSITSSELNARFGEGNWEL